MTKSAVLNNPFARFLITGIVLYVIWSLIYHFWLDPIDIIDRPVIDSLIGITGYILRAVGYETIPIQDPSIQVRVAGIDGTTGVWVGDPCNGISLFALFIIFVVAYPGKWKHRLWFIPIGLLSIHLLNAVRIASLAIVLKYHPEWLNFNHDYTFTILVYSWVFFLWYTWTRMSLPKDKHEPVTTA